MSSLDNGNTIGTPFVFSCPECGGVLWEVQDGELLRFRCRVGHAFFADSKLSAPSEEIEDALWAALKTLEESASLSRRLASLIAIAIYDVQSQELLVGSPRYLDLVAAVHGLDRHTLVGRKWQDIAIETPRQQAVLAWETALETHRPVRLPEATIQATGSEPEAVWDWSFIPIVDQAQQDQVRYIMVSAVEISEQIRARQEMEQVSHLKDDFLSLASHELRTPLTSLLSYIQLLQRRLDHAEHELANADRMKAEIAYTLETLDKMYQQGNRLNDLIGQMLDITRMRGNVFELQKQEQVDLVALVRRMVEPFRDNGERSISMETNQESITGEWDEERLEQVLTNLLSNAMKYSSADAPVAVGIARQGNEAIVWVRDQGRGISQQEQAHIFDRFYRIHEEKDTTKPGLGLGLFISHEIIAQHGGRMWLESQPGRGSTFYFSLPLSETA